MVLYKHIIHQGNNIEDTLSVVVACFLVIKNFRNKYMWLPPWLKPVKIGMQTYILIMLDIYIKHV
jgi:hypothetical protein